MVVTLYDMAEVIAYTKPNPDSPTRNKYTVNKNTHKLKHKR